MPVSTDSTRAAHVAQWRKPTAYSETVADPPRLPRPVVLRGSCLHVHGVGLVWRRQRYVAWRRCP